MNDDQLKALAKDPDGLLTYEYMANHIDELSADDLGRLAENMAAVDKSGQFTASAARYLFAINPELYAESIDALIAATIDRDRERRYMGDLLVAIWGEDYASRARELSASDNNFRRIYKRMHPAVGL